MKRALDVAASFLGLLLLTPFMVLIALLIKLDSHGPVFFLQERVGKDFKPFRIIKFRTMGVKRRYGRPPITVGEDPRITRFGGILRKTKIDELPQLLNVLKGEMSLVGPRPELFKYVAMFRRDYEEILKVQPGITDLASLKFRDEAGLLARKRAPENFYVRDLLPRKIALAKKYIRISSLWADISLILRTLGRIAGFSIK